MTYVTKSAYHPGSADEFASSATIQAGTRDDSCEHAVVRTNETE